MAAEARTEADVPLGEGRAMRVALDLPAGDAPEGGWPGVVVLHELFGLTDEIREVGASFAARGWAVALPDYFSTGTTLGCLLSAVREIQTHKPGRMSHDLAAVAGWLGERAEVNAERLAVIGFCLGGSFAVLMGGIDSAGMKAVSVNYGDVPDLETVAKLPPTIGSYGAKDRQFAGKAKVLEDRLGSCGITHDVTVYPDSGHSFLTSTASRHPVFRRIALPLHLGYVASDAEPAWQKIFGFLEEHTAAS